MYDEFPRDSPPTQPESGTPELVAAEALGMLHVVFERQAEQSRTLTQLVKTELTNNQELTALPANTGNKHFRQDETEIATRDDFLQSRLHGLVLDMGAGPGNELEGKVASGARVIYFDSQPSTDPAHVQGDARQTKFGDQEVDSIFSRNCLGTGDDLDTRAIIAEARRILKPEGVMVLATMYATEEATSKGVLDTLRALEDTGVDITDPKQCEIIVMTSTVEHDSYVNEEGPNQGKAVSLTYPEVFLTVHPG